MQEQEEAIPPSADSPEAVPPSADSPADTEAAAVAAATSDKDHPPSSPVQKPAPAPDRGFGAHQHHHRKGNARVMWKHPPQQYQQHHHNLYQQQHFHYHQQQQQQNFPQLNSKQQNVPVPEGGSEATPQQESVTLTPSTRPIVKRGEHGLETSWTIWFAIHKRDGGKKGVRNFEEDLQKIGSFSSLEEFSRYYLYLRPPRDLPNISNFYVFRNESKPMWEAFPNGGCWIVRVPKDDLQLTKKWEDLLFAAIGEDFEEPDVVGVALCIRKNTNLFCVWNSDNRSSNQDVRFRIGQKLRKVFGLAHNDTIEYKTNRSAMQDQGTFHNTTVFVT